MNAGEPIDKPLYIHRQTCYLFGRERRVADVPLDHPSISKQHAVMQYRYTKPLREWATACYECQYCMLARRLCQLSQTCVLQSVRTHPIHANNDLSMKSCDTRLLAQNNIPFWSLH